MHNCNFLLYFSTLPKYILFQNIDFNDQRFYEDYGVLTRFPLNLFDSFFNSAQNVKKDIASIVNALISKTIYLGM